MSTLRKLNPITFVKFPILKIIISNYGYHSRLVFSGLPAHNLIYTTAVIGAIGASVGAFIDPQAHSAAGQ